MSAPAPTTFRFGDLPSELNDMIVDSLGGDDQRNVAQASTDLRNRTEQLYLWNYRQTSDLIRTYNASQEAPPVVPGDAYLQTRALSLIDKTNRVLGGNALVDRVSARASPLYSGSQLELANARWNCKVIGLIPFLKLIPEAQGCLTEVAKPLSDREKFEIIIEWIKNHPNEVAAVTRVEIIHCKKVDVQSFTVPRFYDLAEKVYNVVPKEISYFTGLQELSFYNNFLNEVPEEIASLPLKTLNLGANFLIQMPPVIPTLRRLLIESNEGRFAFYNVARFIDKYIEKGGECLEITLPPEYFEDHGYQALISQIDAAGTHTLRLELKNRQSVFTIQKKLEATQPSDYQLDET